MRSFWSILWVLLSFIQAEAQLASSPPLGPRALAMGNTSVSLKDAWSLFNNPAGLADFRDPKALFAYQTILDFAPFNTVSAGIVIPTSFGTAGISTYRFGDDLFNSQMLSGIISRKIGIMQLGLKANYLQYNIEGFGRSSMFLADIGLIAQLTREIVFGAKISNFTQSSISSETNERIPTIIKLGIAFKATNELSLLLEGEKDVDLDTDLKFGMEYQIINKVKMRTGFTSESKTHSFGIGINLNRFLIDYGIRINRFLGNSHNLGIIHTFSKK